MQSAFPGFMAFSSTSLVAQMVKCLPRMPETQVRSLGREDPLEKGKVTHSSMSRLHKEIKKTQREQGS